MIYHIRVPQTTEMAQIKYNKASPITYINKYQTQTCNIP